MQNIHRHLYKALTTYRKAFKGAKTEQDQDKIRKALHTKLWQNRYLVFTNEENLSPEQRQTLDELLAEHFDNICTYLRVPTVQRNSLSECTVRSLRRIEHMRQGFKTQQGRVNHLKLLHWRTYIRSAS